MNKVSQRGYRHNKARQFMRFVLPTLILLLAGFNLVTGTNKGSEFFFGNKHPDKRNVIFFVTDGMGPTSLSLTRSFRQYAHDLAYNNVLVLDQHLIGSSRTRASDSLVTDSAAGATAFACALKSYNGAIGVDSDRSPCGTILEGAKLAGYHTGLVVTTRITDATPGAFSAHADFRSQEDLIAEQQLGEYPLGRQVDLLIGGGRTHFYSGNSNSKYGNRGSRTDGRNLISIAEEKGWQYVSNREQFDQLQLGQNVSLPLLALLADYDIPFDLDRKDEEYPSLEEETITAINALNEATKDSDKGFFLLVEGSRIDHAGHQNDPAAQVREVLAFDRAFQAAKELADKSQVETVLISTSDHETGGLAASRQVTKSYPSYVWYPQVLFNAHHSGEYCSKQIENYKGESKKSFVQHEVLEKMLEIYDYTSDDVNYLTEEQDRNSVQDKLNDMISYRAEVGWSTHGHSAVDVNIYAYSNRKKALDEVKSYLQGNHENIEIGDYMARYLNIDLSQVTKKVRDTKHSPDAKSLTSMVDEYGHGLNDFGII
ncbi:vacuolar alkaline phosphatase [Zygosaccharomyces mellis]|uniref:Alkaline phosphatase n=1 Tax=Zygosaccharomyces mellis TaxID=42258 RepID=A0A4C2E9N1_9SACH|nr:vacuolar alkaline phosphatase [Zygosaccharomyces mellis]